MKNQKRIITALSLLAVSWLMSCGDAAKKDVKDVDGDLKEAAIDAK